MNGYVKTRFVYKVSPELEEYLCDQGLKGDDLKASQKMFMVTFEERDQLLRPIAESGQEAVGSMGDDTPMAVLSRQVRHVSGLLPSTVCSGHQPTNRPIT